MCTGYKEVPFQNDTSHLTHNLDTVLRFNKETEKGEVQED